MKNNSKFSNCLRKIKAVRLGQIWNLVVRFINVGWKVTLVLVGFMLISEIISDLSWHLRDDEWITDSRRLSDHVSVYEYSDGSTKVYDTEENKCILKDLKWVSGIPKRDSLTVFCNEDGKRGFLNINTGRVEIEATYSHAWHFSQGIAAVVDDSGKLGFIDHDGNVVIPMQYDYDEECDYVFVDGHCAMPDTGTDLWGVIGLSGECVIPYEYECLSYDDTHHSWISRKDGYEGLWDSTLQEIFPNEYDEICFTDKTGEVYLVKDGLQQLVAYDGTVIQPFVISGTWTLSYKEYDAELDENIYVQHPYLVGYQVATYMSGVMDSRTGKVVVPALYSRVSLISKDLIRAEIDYDDNSVIFTSSGVIVE